MSREDFETILERLFGEEIRKDPDVKGAELWSALANIIWVGPSGEEESYSFRGAGGLIARMVGDDSVMAYMRWYCSGPYETVSDEIATKMNLEGWAWKTYPEEK